MATTILELLTPQISINDTNVRGVLSIAHGGTGVTSATGTNKAVLSDNPVLVAPTLGTPASGNLSLCTNAIAYSIKTASNIVTVSSSAAPTIGQGLVATSASTAEWQTLPFGTVTNLTLTVGSSGTDVNSSVTSSSSTPALTLNIPTASASVRGVLSSTDWTTFNNKLSSIPNLYAGTTLLTTTSVQKSLTGITGFSTTASSTSTPSLNIAVSTGANSVTGLSYYNTASGGITISSGSTASGSSGGVAINTGDAALSGDINIKPGVSTSSASSVYISAGDGNIAGTSYGGNLWLSAGAGIGGATASNGGNAFFKGGSSSASTVDSTGGNAYIFGGGASPYATGTKINGDVIIGTQETTNVNIASTAYSAKVINIGSSSSTTTIAGTAKFPGVGTSGLVSLGAAGVLSALTPSIGYLNWTGTAFEWSAISSSYILPSASDTTLGGVKVDNSTITINNGVISATATAYTLPTAGVGAGGTLGGVKVDNSTITINNGVISASSTVSTGLTIGTSLTIPAGDTASRPTATQGNLRFNTSLGKFEGYYGSAWGAVGGGLSPTAIQTANGYVAKANDLVRCNTTGGTFSITLPSAPVDGDIIGVVDTHRKFALNNLIILAAGSKTIEDDTTSLVLDINGSYIALVYNDVNSNWRILETPLGTGIIATAIKTSNGYVASVNDLVRCNTTSAAFSVTLPTNPNDGSIVNFVDVASAGSFSTNNLTVLAGSGNTVQNSSSLVLNVNGAYVSLVYNLSTTNWKLLQLSLPTASTSVLGGVKVDGSTIIINGSGVISSTGGGGGASATKTISNKVGAYTVVVGDLGKIINCTGGTFTVSLTAAATLGSGFTCTIWNTSTTITDAITIDPNLSETIDGKPSLILQVGEGLSIVCDGTNWQTDNKKPMRNYAENCANTNTRPIATGINSVAIGNSTTASATAAYAIGYATQATSLYGFAIGTNSGNTGSFTATGDGAMALGGSYASGTDSFAAAIANNTSSYGATGANGIAIGQLATASGTRSFAAQNNAAASGQDSIAFGRSSQALQPCSVALGYAAKSNVAGKFAYAGGLFAGVGDAQHGTLVLYAVTVTSTVLVLTTDGQVGSTTNQPIVASGQAMTFFGTLIAKQSASANIASYIIKGAIVNNAGTVTISTISVETIVDTIGLTTQPTYTVDSTNKGLNITSGAKAATNIRWVCTLQTSEVTFV